jgi:peptide/nickel transport system substrate-binding protein
MSHRPKWLSPLAAVMAVSVLALACGTGGATPAPATPAATTAAPATPAPATPTPAPATSAPATPAPATSAPATATATAVPATSAPASPTASPAPAGLSYPTDGKDAPCGDGTYKGTIKHITAIDASTVEFALCSPDVAFLAKVAFAAFAINDSAYLKAHVADGSIVNTPNGTGSYKLKEWRRGDQVILEANANSAVAPKVPAAVFRWNTESTARLSELQAGTVDGIDNVGPTDFDTVKNDTTLALKPREALNVMYIGMSNAYPPFDNELVRQAFAYGIDRDRIVKNFYPAGSDVATKFTPCSIPHGCAGDDWYAFDATKAKALLTEAGYGASKPFPTIKIHYRNVARGYVPQPKQTVEDLQAQLKENLGITAEIDEQESTTYLDNANAGKLDGIHLLGWGADYPDVTNFLDFHFGGGSSPQFGAHYDDIVAALNTGATTADDTAREAAYVIANNLVRQHVPMVPIVHGGSATAWRADVQGSLSSPLGNEILGTMTPGDRQQIVFMQNGEPGGLYCADETDGEALRVCEQILESLYQYEAGGTATQPALAESCTPNTELTTWTCKLKSGIKFADGATLDADDVVTSFGIQWDAADPLHKGRTGDFTYFSALFGGFLHPEAIPTPPPPPTARWRPLRTSSSHRP